MDPTPPPNHKATLLSAIDMRYYWLQDRECQEQFKIEWAAGANNKADYFTKHFSVSHHREKRPEDLHTK